MKRINLTVYWVLFAFLVLGGACTSSVPAISDPPEEIVVPVEVDPTKFAEHIQQKTTLVKSITTNTTETIHDGLTYTEITYEDQQDRPMALFILFADLDKGVTLAATAATNAADLEAKETVRKQIEHVTGRSYEVLAAVNGDFWRVSDDIDGGIGRRAYGSIHIDGERKKGITRTSQYYFTALMKNGTFTMGNKAAYERVEHNIQESIGARHLLVNDGSNVSDQITNTVVAPRTAVGKFSPDQLVFVVVDGRRASHSQGLSLQDLGKVFEAIGVETALNLDGGGSSTILVKDEDDFALKNRPSDNVERAVANAWTIVKKK